ncbi:hypothetical protein H2248_008872 [Termitomyces sp. 'cryptogamus']|nr:hypothetical protein H2248_008872 [Termitomyces sp. 'cryptogamus']
MSTTSTLRLNAADDTIKSVTIFKSSKAEVVRQFSLNLKAGQTKVEISGLSESIDTQSVRVSGLEQARLYDVVCTIGGGKDMSYVPDSPSEIIRLLQVKKHALESEKRVREHEADLLMNYAKTLSGEHVLPTQMNTFLESFVEQGRKNIKDIAELDEKIIALGRRIERETEKGVAKKGSVQGEAIIILGTDNPSVVDLKLTYVVGNVSWTPTYELHAKAENGKPLSTVALHYRARVSQSTGEDWTNVSLTLSTNSDTIAKRIPQLMPVKLRPRSIFSPGRSLFGKESVGNQQQPFFRSDGGNGGGSLFGQPNTLSNPLLPTPQAIQPQPLLKPLFGASSSSGITTAFGVSTATPTGGLFGAQIQNAYLPPKAEEVLEKTSPAEIRTEPMTSVSETPVAVSFSITGKSTIPSDGIEHQVSVAILPFEAEISYVVIPRIESSVYLQCQVKNSSEYKLLAGPVSVIFDDRYVSRTSISDVNAGENFKCTLGSDVAMKVTYTRTAHTVKSQAGHFTEARNTTTYTSVITIYNKHDFALSDVVVRDAVPMVDDKRAKVILRKPEGLADTKDGEEATVYRADQEVGKVAWEKPVDGKEEEEEGKGKFTWKVNIEAKNEITLESQWDLKAPADGTHWQEVMGD